MRTDLCDKLGIEFPIFAFSHCRDVVAAVSKAGGLGVLGAVAYSPEELEVELNWIDENVDGKPYGVDTVIPAKYVGRDQGQLDKDTLDNMIPSETKEWLENLLDEHGVPDLPDSVEETESLIGWSTSAGRSHVEVALKHPIKLIANALGTPPADVIETAHKHDVMVAALVGTPAQALKQKEAGVDIIIASGYEAGGHTGEITSMVLWPQCVEACAPTPVLAAGGVGGGKQMAAALALGCQGVWTGSIWLTVSEADGVPALVDKLIDADSTQTRRSRCISGKPARQLITPYTEAWDGEKATSPGTLPMPLQWMATATATQRIHRHAQTGGAENATLLGTPVGQVVGQMNHRRPAKNVVQDMVNECVDTLMDLSERLQSLAG